MSIDYKDVRDLHLSSLRHIFGIVQQEPILFNRSIADNIRYGMVDTLKLPKSIKNFQEAEVFSSQIPMHDVIKAAEKSFAHEFIKTLPLGYDTRLAYFQMYDPDGPILNITY